MLITVRTKTSKKMIPFTVSVSNSELSIELDEAVVTALFTQSSNATKVEVKQATPKILNQDDTSITLFTKESILSMAEFPAQYVKYLPQQVISMFSTNEMFRNSLSENAKHVQDQYRNALKALNEAYAAKKISCPTCEQGKLNRTFIPAIIRVLFSDEEQNWLVDIMNCGLQTYNSVLQPVFANEIIGNLNNEYVTELQKAVSNPQGCTQCAKNAIRNRYDAKLMELVREHNKNFKPKD